MSLLLLGVGKQGAFRSAAAFAQEKLAAPRAAATRDGDEVPVAVAHEHREEHESTDEPQAVVPSGQEELVADILGRGEPFPGACTFTGGAAMGSRIRATYACASGEVIFELVHPSRPVSPLVKTDRFALTLRSGSPPEGLVQAVAFRIRVREEAFEWKWIGRSPPAPAGGPSERGDSLAVEPSRPRPTALLALAAFAAVVALGWALHLRASAPDRRRPRSAGAVSVTAPARRGRRSLLEPAVLVALFVGALIVHLRLAGSSPIVWADTVADENQVQACLADDSCTLTGVSTSVPGQVHAVAWLQLRTLIAWLGAGLDGAHLTMIVLNALAVVLVFHLATRLGGPLAGVLAVWIFLDRIDRLLRAAALYNSTPLLFFGAVFVLACTVAVLRPSVVSIALAALVAAVMANIHLACVLTGASVVWVALNSPRQPALHALFGAAVFALASFSLAPQTWEHNLINLLQHPSGHLTPPANAPDNPALFWAIFAPSAWALSFAIRTRAGIAYRRRLQGVMAVIVPFIVPFLLAPRFGLYPEPKYLLHVKAACAIAAAIPIATVAGAMLRLLSPRLLVTVERIAPAALALTLALPPPLGVRAGTSQARDERVPTYGDLTAAVRILHDENGWDLPRMLERLQTPFGVALMGALPHITVTAGDPHPTVADAGGGALLLILAADDLPDPLPPSWRIVRRASTAATVLVLLPSSIDRSAFEVCSQSADGPEPQCEQSGWRFDRKGRVFVPHLPPPARGGHVRIEVRLPISSPGFAGEVFMPRLRFLCGGRIISPSGAVLQVAADGRRAVIAPNAPDAPGKPTIDLEWRVGSPECDVLDYDGLLPFFVDGDAATVGMVEAILRKPGGRRS